MIKKKVIEHKMCVLIFSITFVGNTSHSRKKWVRCNQKCMKEYVYWSSCKVPIILGRF